MKLTTKQLAILDFIRGFMRDRGVAPTCAEIQMHFHFASPATVSSHLTLLEKKGAIRRETRKFRNIRLPQPIPHTPLTQVPLFGSIPAGVPADQQQESGEYLAIDAASMGISKNAKTFALKVRGDSMTGAGILDGDYVIVEQRSAKNGDIVAASVDGEVTLKRLVYQGATPCLHAENPAYKEIVPVTELTIQGVYRALIRMDKKAA